MADSPRIEDLRRRVQKDPASIAFAQLAEELRRAGKDAEAVSVCRAGLAIHPGYLSARVTLGRALIELDQLDDAVVELELVIKSAPDNLAAMRGLGEIHHRRGDLGGALNQYRSALSLARNDPDLEETVAQLTRKVEPKHRDEGHDRLSFDEAQHELLKHAPSALPTAPGPVVPEPAAPEPVALKPAAPEPVASEPAAPEPVAFEPAPPEPAAPEPEAPSRTRALRTVTALEEWLAAIHVVRAELRA
jgi:tetratricopeptide (TPR) repeat protein